MLASDQYHCRPQTHHQPDRATCTSETNLIILKHEILSIETTDRRSPCVIGIIPKYKYVILKIGFFPNGVHLLVLGVRWETHATGRDHRRDERLPQALPRARARGWRLCGRHRLLVRRRHQADCVRGLRCQSPRAGLSAGCGTRTCMQLSRPALMLAALRL